MSGNVKAGFLGAIFAGFLAGYVARFLARRSVPEWLRPVMPIFVIPLISTIIVGFFMLYFGVYIGEFMGCLRVGLNLYRVIRKLLACWVKFS